MSVEDKVNDTINEVHRMTIANGIAFMRECDEWKARAEKAEAERDALRNSLATASGSIIGMHHVIREVTARAEKAEAVLKRIQWNGDREDGLRPRCPDCAFDEDMGHDTSCDIAAALAKPEEPTP